MGGYAHYFSALERLKNNCPDILPRGSPINYDNVALEAGRKKGAIRRERQGMALLRGAIDEAAEEQRTLITPQDRLKKANDEVERFKSLWEQSIGRELCLARQVRDLKEEIKALNQKLPLRVVK